MPGTMPRSIFIGAGVLAIAGAATLVATGPARPQADSAHSGQNQPAQPGQEGRGDGIGAMLWRGLKATEGCLGVESATTASGKDLIMAWFEDAEAARRWYNSPVHLRMVGMFGAPPKEKALEHVPDGTPVLVIASLTMSDDDRIPGSPMPISQIAIELYTTLPGGAFVNSRLAPDALHVDHMTDHTPPSAPPAQPDADTEPAEVVPADA